MAAMLASGPLPSQVAIVEEQVVRPSSSARRTRRIAFVGAALGMVLAAGLFALSLRGSRMQKKALE
jgi:hypothetical protein